MAAEALHQLFPVLGSEGTNRVLDPAGEVVGPAEGQEGVLEALEDLGRSRLGPERREGLLALSQWPALSGLTDAQVEDEIGWVVRLIGEIRSVRTEMNVPAGAKIPLVITGASDVTVERAKRHDETIRRRCVHVFRFSRVPQAQLYLGIIR